MREGGDYKKKKYKNEEDEGENKRRKGEQKGDKSSKWDKQYQKIFCRGLRLILYQKVRIFFGGL